MLDIPTLTKLFSVIGDGLFMRRALDPNFDTEALVPAVMALIGKLLNVQPEAAPTPRRQSPRRSVNEKVPPHPRGAGCRRCCGDIPRPAHLLPSSPPTWAAPRTLSATPAHEDDKVALPPAVSVVKATHADFIEMRHRLGLAGAAR